VVPAVLAGLDVVTGRILRGTAVNLLPDVIQVVALAQGRDNRHRLTPASRSGADHDRQVVHGCEGRNEHGKPRKDHGLRVPKRPIMIRN
jgi:hypothetical protein